MEMKVIPFWRRRRVLVFCTIILFPFLSLFVLTRSFVLSPIIAASLRSELGAEVTVHGSNWGWGSGVQINEVILKADGIEGLAADVITLQKVSVEFDSFLPLFSPEITAIDIESIRIRLAESYQHPGEFNFSHLINSKTFMLPQLSDGSTKDNQQAQTPPVSLQSLTVETGVMQEGDWTLDSSKIFTVVWATQDETSTTLQLIDKNESLTINLLIGSSPLEILAEIQDVQLDKSIFSLLPRTARTWCEETQLHGGINALDIKWDSEQGIQIEASIENLQFQLPEEHGVPWAAYRDGVVKRIWGDSSLDVKQGKIIYDGQNVLLSGIKGFLMPPQQEKSKPLEFSAEMKIYEFKSVGAQQGDEWMNSMLSDSPFKATFKINDFSPVEGHPGEVRVPLAAAQMLKIFQLEHWDMNAVVTVGRTEFKGDIDVRGKFAINAKEGKYVEFPYPLKNIRSSITFHQNDIQIVELKADGSGDSEVLINGDVDATADDLVVHLNLYALNAPIDKFLRDAVSDQLATVIDKMVDYEAYEQIFSRLEDTEDSSFALGGEIDLNLLIVHDSKRDSGVELSGSILLEDIGILHKEFPYPVILRKGRVTIDRTGLHVPEDTFVWFEGYGEGRGYLAGDILFLDDGSAAPALAIKLEGEQITSALVGAVFESAGEANKLAAGILGGLGLTSKLNMSGNVIGSDEGVINSSFSIELINGTSKPNEKLVEAMNVAGPFWPEGFEFTDINAEIHIVNGVVTMKGVTCKCEDGSLEASMEINKGDFDLKIRGEGLPISPRFADVLPKSSSSKLSSSWRWLEPTGSMDAVIWMSHSEDKSDLYMTIEPTELNVSGKDRTTELKLKHGSIVVEGENVFFNDLEFQLSETGEPQGSLEISGEFNGKLEAYWDDVAIDSPLARAITGIVGGESSVKHFDSMQPAGTATARALMTTQGDGNEILYNIEIVPATLSATFHKRRAVAIFDGAEISANNIIRFNNDGLHFDYLLGTLGSGDFSLNGEILSDEVVEGSFDLAWSGPTGDQSLFAVLPSAVGDTLVAIDLKEGNSNLPNGKVTFEGNEWEDLSVKFHGDIALDGVSMDVGIPLKKIKGIARMEGEYNEDKLEVLDMSIAFEELSTLGRMITDVAGSLEYAPKEKQFVFNGMRGESSLGGVTVRGWIGLDESKEYEIEILIAGVELATEKGEGIVATLKGELRGLFSIAGKRGDADSRRGVGRVRVENGHFDIDPFSLTTMRVLQLAFPSAKTISGAEIDLYIKGDQIILEEITLRSSETDITGFSLEGEGTIDFDTFQIQARLHPRAGLPILRDIAGVLNDQLYSIDVTGELLDPNVSVVPLPFLNPQDN